MDKVANYQAILREIDFRLQKGGDLIGDLGNVAAVIKKRLRYYWVGFYFLRDGRLVLGPFQGTPACVFLEPRKGVCWACVERRSVLIVPDVHTFAGHIACDPQAKSEIVVPLFDVKGNLRAVLDIDHDEIGVFDEIDHRFLVQVAERIIPLWTQ